tara:strand:+ start:4227 stop:4403 length:177 start_codon:yes stop_codon:yes gene_type:complete
MLFKTYFGFGTGEFKKFISVCGLAPFIIRDLNNTDPEGDNRADQKRGNNGTPEDDLRF